ncbi:hypothetical protein [Fodinicurvata sediminis]|uniref:hypothetical protein n=1 Tax=Fodinicurvata sediminis TaxID=1121832 RepID=UPI0012DF81ED|nr:hypothetical protein [Fodinicurvata sediminis]
MTDDTALMTTADLARAQEKLSAENRTGCVEIRGWCVRLRVIIRTRTYDGYATCERFLDIPTTTSAQLWNTVADMISRIEEKSHQDRRRAA